MEKLIAKYVDKLIACGLAEPGNLLLGGLDADLVWSRPDPLTPVFENVFKQLNINSLLYCRPREPYASIIEYLARGSDGAIYPKDSETRTFLHDLPVVYELSAETVGSALVNRKCVLVPDGGVVTYGTVSPEQTFVNFSSVCFACFVKFHADCLKGARDGKLDPRALAILGKSEPTGFARGSKPLSKGPFMSEDTVHAAMIETGRRTVEYGLVDSFFGNISYLAGDTVYISQTGSSLDELEGCIESCPVDGSKSTGITASSELVAHQRILMESGKKAILHGHPKFSVIMSLDCEQRGCELEGQCHVRCPTKRYVQDIPIVPGEVGTGSRGLCNTLPPVMKGPRGAIVYGHGLFTTGQDDYREAFESMVDIEKMCQNEFWKRIQIEQ
jgi:ribulose-5-phosphate 4-epimerase/fuculose-1-phosphate aldolase